MNLQQYKQIDVLTLMRLGRVRGKSARVVAAEAKELGYLSGDGEVITEKYVQDHADALAKSRFSSKCWGR